MKRGKSTFFKSVTLCLLLAFGVSILSGGESQAASKPAKPSFTVSKRTKTTATIKIKKKDKVTGYQVYVKKGKKGKYRLWTFSFKRTFKIKKLKAGSVYYVKIRAYRTKRLQIKKGKFSGAKKIKKYKKAKPITSPTPTPSTTTEKDYAQQVLTLVNSERAKEGLSPLTLDNDLNEVAMIRAREIVDNFSHTRPDGTDCFTALSEKNIKCLTAGENIAAGQQTPAEVMAGWMNSEGHRANILSDKFGKLGVGLVKSTTGNGYYWVQIFTD